MENDLLKIPEILSEPTNIELPLSNPTNGQGVMFTKLYPDGKMYCIMVDEYETEELSVKTGYKKPVQGIDVLQADPKHNVRNDRTLPSYDAKVTNFFIITKQNHNYFSGLDGLTESQWANELAKHEDWRYLDITIGGTKDYRNVIIILKPFIINRGGKNGVIQYWMTCKKEEIEYQIKIIDKVFQILIDTFPDWQTKNPIRLRQTSQ